ncbi:MAG: porin [Sutterella sp.]|nr:porin [Sutterella sp.]
MQFKAKLGMLAAAMALSFGAQGANVTLYGSVSTGVVLSGTAKLTDADTVEKRSTNLAMESAWAGDSIFGLTGEEELGNGWTVGFTLENEFSSDSGQLASDGTIFDSQAYLRIGNEFVNIAAGNIGGLASACGDFDLVGGFDPLEAAYGVGGMGVFASRDYASANTAVVELTPAEGLKISAMGSFGEEDKNASWAARTHYYGIGVSYEAGPLAVAAVAEMMNYDSSEDKQDNGYTYTVGVSYDFEVVKPMFMYQHADKVLGFQGEDIESSLKADSFLIGATAPLGSGTLAASAQYLKAKDAETGAKAEATVLGVAYTYEMSKRTSLYAGATYAFGGKGLGKNLSGADAEFGALADLRGDFNGWQAGIGINHAF